MMPARTGKFTESSTCSGISERPVVQKVSIEVYKFGIGISMDAVKTVRKLGRPSLDKVAQTTRETSTAE